jgi:hypothetical protein
VLVYVEPNCVFSLTEIMMFVYFETVEDLHRSIIVVLCFLNGTAVSACVTKCKMRYWEDYVQ